VKLRASNCYGWSNKFINLLIDKYLFETTKKRCFRNGQRAFAIDYPKLSHSQWGQACPSDLILLFLFRICHIRRLELASRYRRLKVPSPGSDAETRIGHRRSDSGRYWLNGVNQWRRHPLVTRPRSMARMSRHKVSANVLGRHCRIWPGARAGTLYQKHIAKTQTDCKDWPMRGVVEGLLPSWTIQKEAS
jgi:hypothetical protein